MSDAPLSPSIAAVDAAIARLAASQAGAFSIDQARALGASPSLVRRRRSTGRWQRLTTHVLAMAGAPATELQRRWAIRLSLGLQMTISHEWAGRLAQLPAIHDGIWSVTVPTADHRRRAGFTVHQQRLAREDVTDLDGFAVTTVPRTLCDLATTSSTPRLRTMVEAAAFDLGWSFDSLWTALLRTGTVGRPGASRLISVLEEHRPGRDVARTKLEAALDDVLSLTRLPVALAQHPLPSTGHRLGLVDRVLPAAKLILEADGRRWHARVAAMVVDRERDLEAARRGWFTLRVMYEQLVGDPDDIAAAILETYQLRVAA